MNLLSLMHTKTDSNYNLETSTFSPKNPLHNNFHENGISLIGKVSIATENSLNGQMVQVPTKSK